MNRCSTWTLMFIFICSGFSFEVGAVTPGGDEFAHCRKWLKQFLGKQIDKSVSNPYLFSFIYRGESSREILGAWRRSVTTENTAEGLHRQVIYLDPKTHLEVRVEATLFDDFPAMEWVLYFRNTGKADTPILEDIQSLDAVFDLPISVPPTLHWAKGAVAGFDDFAPQTCVLKGGAPLFRLEPGGGRSSSQVLPFFNFESAGKGIIVAIGWTGEWRMECAADPDGVIVKSGMAQTHLRLHPNEEIRSPRMLVLPYSGDRWRGQNLWRQFVLAHHRPCPAGKPLRAPITCGNWGGTPARIHLDNIEKIIRHNLPIDYYWIDAEWFGKPDSLRGWPVNVGNWIVKKDLYPNGFKPISDRLRQGGRKLLLWFEPERVYKRTLWYEEHHDWLIDIGEENSLFNLGIPEARKFLADFISAKVDEFGLGCYRQDFNIDPLRFWRAMDAPDRQGITEIRYIEGLYAFWDELLADHPELIIDNCASGGRRIDLETLGRATPFWRTDGPRDPIAHQCHTMGLLPWVPLSATSQDRAGDDYEFRSSMCSALCLNWWVSGDVPAGKIPDEFPFRWAKETLDGYLQIRDDYYGDFYPLTQYSQSREVWVAYQLDRPDLDKGLIVALKRPESPYTTTLLNLHELEADRNYQVRNLDARTVETYTGKDLVDVGLEVRLDKNPDSALYIYKCE